MHGNEERARAVLQRVNGSIKGYDIEENLRVIKNTLEEERQTNHYESFGDLVRSYKQALSGVNGVGLSGSEARRLIRCSGVTWLPLSR